jgi:hypothetical protein
VQIFEGYYTRTVNDVLGGVLGDILGGNTGELGIPDPPGDWQELDQVIGGDGLGDVTGQASGETQRLDNFNANPVVLQQSLANASDRESARSMATSVLGTEGQTAMKQEMDAAEQALSAIADKSQEAQSLDVTQDVMKNLTDMVSHQSQLESGSYEQLMQLRQQSATANLIGANISEALDEGNRAKHAEEMAGAQQVVQAAANVYLPGASIITAVVVWSWNKIQQSRILNRRAAFFGLLPKEQCFAVMNQNPKSLNTMSHSDVQTLVEVVKLAEKIEADLKVAPFEQFLEPPGSVTEFCLGGPDSNQRTKIHLANFLQGVRFNPYMPGDSDNIAILVQGQKFQYEKNQKEHAILARFYPDSKSHPVILVSGQTARSNQGAVYYLINNYEQDLRRKFGCSERFCLLIKLQSPLIYGYKSARLEQDLTKIAFSSFF